MRAGLTIAILAILTNIAPMPAAAVAPPDTGPSIFSLSIQLDAPSQAARVTDTAPGIVMFTGQVSVDKLPVQRVGVALESSVDTGWVSQVSPTQMIFTSTTPQAFTATAVVPQGTMSTLIGRLLIHGTASGTGVDSEATANGTITVDQYFRVTLSSDGTDFETDKSGVSTNYRLVVTNAGNGPDSFTLSIANLQELRSKGWTVRLDKEVTPVVKPRLYSEVAVTVTSPKDSPAFEGTSRKVIVNASSVGARAYEQVITQSFNFIFNQTAIDPVFDVTVPVAGVGVVVASVAVAAWRWRKRRKGAIEADAGNASSDEAIVVEAD